jgi:hypothetical protein
MGLDYLACAQAETAYNAFVTLLDQIVEFPLALLKTLRNMIKMLEATIYKNIEDFFEELLDLFNKYLEFPDSPDDLTDDFCEALLQCEFLYKAALPESTNGTYFDPLSGEYLSGYEWFKRNICTYGLGAYIDELKQYALDSINSLIDKIEGNIGKGFIYINQTLEALTEEYNNFINRPITDYFPLFDDLWTGLVIFNWIDPDVFDPATASILDVINLIDLFGRCIFSVCDLSVTVQNKLEDIADKLSINLGTGQYVPNNSQIKMRTKEKEIAAKIATINAAT